MFIRYCVHLVHPLIFKSKAREHSSQLVASTPRLPWLWRMVAVANCSPGPYDCKEVRFTQYFATRVAAWPSRKQVKLNDMHDFISLPFFQSKRQVIWQNFVILCDRRPRGNVSRIQDQLPECRISSKIPGIHYLLCDCYAVNVVTSWIAFTGMLTR